LIRPAVGTVDDSPGQMAWQVAHRAVLGRLGPHTSGYSPRSTSPSRSGPRGFAAARLAPTRHSRGARVRYRRGNRDRCAGRTAQDEVLPSSLVRSGPATPQAGRCHWSGRVSTPSPPAPPVPRPVGADIDVHDRTVEPQRLPTPSSVSASNSTTPPACRPRNIDSPPGRQPTDAPIESTTRLPLTRSTPRAALAGRPRERRGRTPALAPECHAPGLADDQSAVLTHTKPRPPLPRSQNPCSNRMSWRRWDSNPRPLLADNESPSAVLARITAAQWRAGSESYPLIERG
jgi:hypothetical protein